MKEHSPLFSRSIAVIVAIPEGTVTTYGRVASLIDAPGCARHVSYILSSSSKKYKLPWHRVISSSGNVPEHSSFLKQLGLLRAEGIEIEHEKIDLEIYGWNPTKKQVRDLLKGIPRHVPISEK